MNDIILYHGSRGGIDGPIAPTSRARCDFGKGFYMGQHEMQAKGLVVDDSAPFFYKINLKLSEIPEKRILMLDEKDWLYTVLACRKKTTDFSNLPIAQIMEKRLRNYDVIIGPIADDRMNEAIQAFSSGLLSDVGLEHCLKHVGYGNQYVLKTDFACSKAEILEEKSIGYYEAEEVREYNAKMRKAGRNAIQEAVRATSGQGKYIYDIIREAQGHVVNNSEIEDAINDLQYR